MGLWRSSQKMGNPFRAPSGPSGTPTRAAPPSGMETVSGLRSHSQAPTPTHPLPHQPVVPALLSSASATAHKEHARRLKSLQKRSPPPPTTAPSASLKRKLQQMAQQHFRPEPSSDPPSHASSAGPWTQRIQALFQPTPAPTGTPPVIMHEWNAEASTLVTVLAARFMGMEPRSLANSPGLRALVVQQLGWLHPAPDWLKLAGLLLTKKWNQMLLPNPPPQDLSPHSMSGLLLDHSDTEHPSMKSEENETTPTPPAPEDFLLDDETLPPPTTLPEEEILTTTPSSSDDTDVVGNPPTGPEAPESIEMDATPTPEEPPTKRARRTKRARPPVPEVGPPPTLLAAATDDTEKPSTQLEIPKKRKTKTRRTKPALTVSLTDITTTEGESLLEDTPTVTTVLPPPTPHTV